MKVLLQQYIDKGNSLLRTARSSSACLSRTLFDRKSVSIDSFVNFNLRIVFLALARSATQNVDRRVEQDKD